jgi:probable rRNA maturation factor
MIFIKNTLRTTTLDIDALITDAQVILDALQYSDYDVGIWLTTNKTIQKYNLLYRDKDKPTDILSFPFYPHLKAGEKITAHTQDEKNLGDIIISLEYVKKAAQELGVTFENRMKVLLVHGICHLLGYDHIEDADYAIMKKKEQSLLKKITQKS